MKKSNFLRSVIAIFVMAAMMLSLTACGKTPEENFKQTQQDTVDSLCKAVDTYYENLEKYDPKDMNLQADVNVRLGTTLLSMLRSMTAMEFDWIKDLTIHMEENLKDNTLSMGLALSMNGKQLLAADALLDMAQNNVYVAIPVMAEKYLKLNLAESMGVDMDLSQLMSQMDYSKMLPEKDQVKGLIKKYYGIVMENITAVTEAEGTVTAAGISQECQILTVELTQKQAADIILDVMKAVAEDEVIKDIFFAMVDYMNDGMNVEDGVLSADDAYNEMISELKDAIAEAEEEMTDGTITDDVMLKWTTYATKKSVVLGYDFVATMDGESAQLFMAEAQNGTKIGQEFYVTMDGEKMFALEGELTEEKDVLAGTYELFVEGESMAFIDLADVDAKKLEEGTFDGSVSISPSKGLIDLLTGELGTDAPIAGLSLSAVSLKLDVEQSKKDATKVTISLMSGSEEFVAIVVDTAISDGKTVSVPADSAEDAMTWLQSLDFQALLTALDESDLPDEFVEMLQNLLAYSVG